MKKLADGGGGGDGDAVGGGDSARPLQVNNKIPLRFVSHPNTIGTRAVGGGASGCYYLYVSCRPAAALVLDPTRRRLLHYVTLLSPS